MNNLLKVIVISLTVVFLSSIGGAIYVLFLLNSYSDNIQDKIIEETTETVIEKIEDKVGSFVGKP